MTLVEFKRIALAKSSLVDSTRVDVVEDELKREILLCVPSGLSEDTRSVIREFERDLILRHLCDFEDVQPYIGIAQALIIALREQGCSPMEAVDWGRAIELGVRLSATSTESLPLNQQYESDVQICRSSKAVLILRTYGYKVDLPHDGGVFLAEKDRQKIETDILGLAKSLGQSLAVSISLTIKNAYCPITGRFHLGRNGKTVELNAMPERPLAYLYQLGLRYVGLVPSATASETELNDLIDLVSSAMELEDAGVSFFSLQFSQAIHIPEITRKSAIFDAAFILAQAKPTHAASYIGWLLSQPELASLNDKKTGRTCAQVRTFALKLLEIASETPPHEFVQVQPLAANSVNSVQSGFIEKFLREVFTHENGANNKLSFPPLDTRIDGAFRPLLQDAAGGLVMQPAPMAARAIVNASLDWCRKHWPSKGFDEEAVGPLFERFIRHTFNSRGVSVSHGKYKKGDQVFECDGIVETGSNILIFELKSKMLTRQGRSGDEVATLADLAQAVVRPQAQAMNHHATLVEQGSVVLKGVGGNSTIDLGNREVLKISVSRGDLGSLHDRPYLHRLLTAGCTTQFVHFNEKQQGKLDALNLWFTRLRDATIRAGELDRNRLLPFSNTWSISVFYLLVLLEQTKDAESFAKELLRTRRVITPTRDLYREYVQLLDLERRVQASGKSISTR